LHLALDLGNTTWKLAFATSHAHAPRLRTIPARDLAQLAAEIAAARARFGLPGDAPVVSCYEAGRDGFWVHRALLALGAANHVVDSASIQQNRRKRRPKSDRLDASALLALLLRHRAGERRVASGGCGAWCTCRASPTKISDICISKAGSAIVRALAIELAWSWVRRQPTSALARWYRTRFSGRGPRPSAVAARGNAASASSPSRASS
jgi:transposase